MQRIEREVLAVDVWLQQGLRISLTSCKIQTQRCFALVESTISARRVSERPRINPKKGVTFGDSAGTLNVEKCHFPLGRG
jgi:hypothetical protein